MAAGKLTLVSMGMNLAGHISVISKSHIQNADVVFSHTPHELMNSWLERQNSSLVNLHKFYAEGKHRMQTYEEMVEAMLEPVRKGQNVCGAFYGHAGVFACVPHMAIEQAKKEGHQAYMEPGISAEACLYADLAIDPGDCGMQSFEATQFFFFNHQPNLTSYILLWQIGLVGEHTGRKFKTSKDTVEAFIKFLSQWYPLDHKVILYEAAVLPIEKFRADKIAIKDLAEAEMSLKTTMVIPPTKRLAVNSELMASLGISEGGLFKR